MKKRKKPASDISSTTPRIQVLFRHISAIIVANGISVTCMRSRGSQMKTKISCKPVEEMTKIMLTL